MTSSQGQDQRKWYQVIEVNGAYKYGRYEKMWLNSLCAMSTLKFVPCQTAHYIDTYDTHMDKKILSHMWQQ